MAIFPEMLVLRWWRSKMNKFGSFLKSSALCVDATPYLELHPRHCYNKSLDPRFWHTKGVIILCYLMSYKILIPYLFVTLSSILEIFVAFHIISDSNHIGILSTIAHKITHTRYLIKLLLWNPLLDKYWRCLIGRLIAANLSYAIATVMKIDAVRLIFVSGRRSWGYNKMWALVINLNWNPNVSNTSMVR